MKVTTSLTESLVEFDLPALTPKQELENRVRDIFHIHRGEMTDQDVKWQLKTKVMRDILTALVKDKIVFKRGNKYVWPDMRH